MTTVVKVEEEEKLTANKGTINKKAQEKLLPALTADKLTEFKELLKENINVNEVYVNDGRTLLIHACATPNDERVNFVELLLKKGADPNIADYHDRTALHYTALMSNEKSMDLLLTNRRFKVNVNTLDGCGSTPLHNAAAPYWEYVNMESHIRCIRMLMRQEDMELNIPNYFGNTPLWLAQEQPDTCAQQIIKVMLECGDGRIDVDTFHLRDGGLMREVIERNFPSLRRLLPKDRTKMPSREPLMEMLISSNPNLEEFKALLNRENFNVNERFENPYFCTCLELACRRKDLPESFLNALFDKGADIEILPSRSDYPQKIYCSALHQATSITNYNALRVLIKRLNQKTRNIQNYYGHTALHIAAQKQCSPEEESDMQICVNVLLGREDDHFETETDLRSKRQQGDQLQRRLPIDLDTPDLFFGDTALHDAAYYENSNIVMALLESGANMMLKNGHGKRPLDFIDQSTFQEFLDKEIKPYHGKTSSKDSEVIMRYTSLQKGDTKDTDKIYKKREYEMHTIYHISLSHDHRELLKHPIIKNFLDLKWHLLCWYFYIQLTVFVLFTVFFTAYIVLINSDSICTKCKELGLQNYTLKQNFSDTLALRNSESNINCISNCSNEINVAALSLRFEDLSVHGVRIVCVLLLAILTLLEFMQCITDSKRYFTDWENIFEICTITVCAIALSYNWDGNSFEVHVSGIAILLTWIELVLFSGRMPIFSVQLEMLKKVSLTFLRFMIWYSLLLIAFAFSFYILFGKTRHKDTENEEQFFQYPGVSIFKIIIMMVGELNATYSMFNNAPGTSHIIFFIFVFLIVIILLNLLNGLAVSDTQAIKNDAKTLSLVSLVKLMYNLEIMLMSIGSNCLSKHFYEKCVEPMIRVFGRDQKEKNILLAIGNRKVNLFPIRENKVLFENFRTCRKVIMDIKKIFMENKKFSDLTDVKQLLIQMQNKIDMLEKLHNSYNMRKSSLR